MPSFHILGSCTIIHGQAHHHAGGSRSGSSTKRAGDGGSKWVFTLGGFGNAISKPLKLKKKETH